MMNFGRFENNCSEIAATSYVLENDHGMRAVVLDYGATLQRLLVPDRTGHPVDVVLGYDSAAGYAHGDACLGATIGRCCNRTAGAAFSLNGQTYQLAANEGPNNLHSGPDGYHLRPWQYDHHTVTEHEASITLRLESPDGDQGFPGHLSLAVTYTLTDTDILRIEYDGVSDQDTMVNLTNHTYYNLSGEGTGSADGNLLYINADHFLAVDDACLPAGTYREVAETPFDFTVAKPIGRDADPAACEQLSYTHGYNHSYRLRDNVTPAAIACSVATGIEMRLYTSLPELEFYTGDYLNIGNGKNGHAYHARDGYALEAQYAPNSMNAEDQADRPILRKNMPYHEEIILEFGIHS